MYAEAGLMFPQFQNFPQEAPAEPEFCCSLKPDASLGIASSLIRTSSISDYNLLVEGDLFKAPEPVIEEPVIDLDPMTAAISMISCGEDVISPQSLTVSDIESSIENGKLLSEVFYECRKDLLAKEGNETPLSEVLTINIPTVKTVETLKSGKETLAKEGNETVVLDVLGINTPHAKTDGNSGANEEVLGEGPFQKSVSFCCLRSMECVYEEAQLRPNFLDFPVMDITAVYGMRRAYSEGDIKTLGNGNISLIHSPVGQSKILSSEDRREKLTRYRSKKSKRNFGRKIKYACRKALADNQPRIRGRFAKTEEIETFRK